VPINAQTVTALLIRSDQDDILGLFCIVAAGRMTCPVPCGLACKSLLYS